MKLKSLMATYGNDIASVEKIITVLIKSVFHLKRHRNCSCITWIMKLFYYWYIKQIILN